jgi:hypothetical protein
MNGLPPNFVVVVPETCGQCGRAEILNSRINQPEVAKGCIKKGSL